MSDRSNVGPEMGMMIQQAISIANSSPCAKSKRGAVIWCGVTGEWLSGGTNAPALGFECDNSDACRANCNKLCEHAEVKALRSLSTPILEGTLEMLHVKTVDGELVPSGGPSCWQCSRSIASDPRIAGFWLFHEAGWRRYTPAELHAMTLEACDLPIFWAAQYDYNVRSALEPTPAPASILRAKNELARVTRQRDAAEQLYMDTLRKMMAATELYTDTIRKMMAAAGDDEPVEWSLDDAVATVNDLGERADRLESDRQVLARGFAAALEATGHDGEWTRVESEDKRICEAVNAARALLVESHPPTAEPRRPGGWKGRTNTTDGFETPLEPGTLEPPDRLLDMAGLARRLVTAIRLGTIREEILDEAEKRIAAVEGDHFDTLALRPSECRRFVTERLDDLRKAAMPLGYALATHGSGARDVDIVAVPWTEDAGSPEDIVSALMTNIGRCDWCADEQGSTKPHGRRSWSVWLHEYSIYLDLSVIFNPPPDQLRAEGRTAERTDIIDFLRHPPGYLPEPQRPWGDGLAKAIASGQHVSRTKRVEPEDDGQ